MPMPPDFRWKKAAATAYREEVIAFEGVCVVRLYQDAWGLPYIAWLDQHLPRERQTRRLCTGYEQGRAGAEVWVERHQERLRAEVQQARRLGAIKPPKLG